MAKINASLYFKAVGALENMGSFLRACEILYVCYLQAEKINMFPSGSVSDRYKCLKDVE